MKGWRAAVRAWARKEQSAQDQPKDGPENHWGDVLAPMEDPWETARRERLEALRHSTSVTPSGTRQPP